MTIVRVTGAAALLVAAAVHVAQLVSIFHAVPWIGPLFAADAVASTVIAIALFGSHWRVAAALGALVSASALAGLAFSSTVGLFGWQETLLRPSVQIAIGAPGFQTQSRTANVTQPQPQKCGCALADTQHFDIALAAATTAISY